MAALGLLLSGCAQTPLGADRAGHARPRQILRGLHLRSGRLQAVCHGHGGRSGPERQHAGGRRGRHRHGARSRPGRGDRRWPGRRHRCGQWRRRRHRHWHGEQFGRPVRHPAAIRQRVRPMHVFEGQHGAWLWPDDGQCAAATAIRAPTPASPTRCRRS